MPAGTSNRDFTREVRRSTRLCYRGAVYSLRGAVRLLGGVDARAERRWRSSRLFHSADDFLREIREIVRLLEAGARPADAPLMTASLRATRDALRNIQGLHRGMRPADSGQRVQLWSFKWELRSQCQTCGRLLTGRGTRRYCRGDHSDVAAREAARLRVARLYARKPDNEKKSTLGTGNLGPHRAATDAEEARIARNELARLGLRRRR